MKLNESVSGVDEYGKPRRNMYDVRIDGELRSVLEPQGGEGLHVLAEGLPPGDHTLRFFKRTEPWIGGGQIVGLELDDGATVKAVPPARTPDRVHRRFGRGGPRRQKRSTRTATTRRDCRTTPPRSRRSSPTR